jgi:organic hydroperoxide reductase OsmC/OhrA
MTDITLTTTSRKAFRSRSVGDDWEMTVDASGDDGPTPNEVLVANYASCFVAAFRVAARTEDVDNVGQIEIDVTASLDEDDDLAATAFDIRVQSSLRGRDDAILAEARRICHVQAALREELHATISLTDEAF